MSRSNIIYQLEKPAKSKLLIGYRKFKLAEKMDVEDYLFCMGQCFGKNCKLELKINDPIASKRRSGYSVAYDPYCAWEGGIVSSDRIVEFFEEFEKEENKLKNWLPKGNEPKTWLPDAENRIENLEDRLRRMVNPRLDGYYLNDNFVLVKIGENLDENVSEVNVPDDSIEDEIRTRY